MSRCIISVVAVAAALATVGCRKGTEHYHSELGGYPPGPQARAPQLLPEPPQPVDDGAQPEAPAGDAPMVGEPVPLPDATAAAPQPGQPGLYGDDLSIEPPAVIPEDPGAPLHEAVVGPAWYGEPLYVDQAPPEPIYEVAPPCPAAGYDWIGGYWGWSFGINNYVWVTGCWRRPPPGCTWHAGYWAGYRGACTWVPGCWTPRDCPRPPVCGNPPPPCPREPIPHHNRPSPDHCWVPGRYEPHGNGYRWFDGKWERPPSPGMRWCEPQFIKGPDRWYCRPGRWDHRPDDCGRVYPPVVNPRPDRPYCPRVPVPPTDVCKHINRCDHIGRLCAEDPRKPLPPGYCPRPPRGGDDGIARGPRGPHGNNGVGNGPDPQPKGRPPVNDGPGTGPGDPGNRKGRPDFDPKGKGGHDDKGGKGGQDGKRGPHGNNGVGNGVDPQPKGNPPVNDGPGTGPGNPGNRKGRPDFDPHDKAGGGILIGGKPAPRFNGNNGVGNGLDPQPKGNPPVNDGPGTGPGNPGNRKGRPDYGPETLIGGKPAPRFDSNSPGNAFPRRYEPPGRDLLNEGSSSGKSPSHLTFPDSEFRRSGPSAPTGPYGGNTGAVRRADPPSSHSGGYTPPPAMRHGPSGGQPGSVYSPRYNTGPSVGAEPRSRAALPQPHGNPPPKAAPPSYAPRTYTPPPGGSNYNSGGGSSARAYRYEPPRVETPRASPAPRAAPTPRAAPAPRPSAPPRSSFSGGSGPRSGGSAGGGGGSRFGGKSK